MSKPSLPMCGLLAIPTCVSSDTEKNPNKPSPKLKTTSKPKKPNPTSITSKALFEIVVAAVGSPHSVLFTRLNKPHVFHLFPFRPYALVPKSNFFIVSQEVASISPQLSRRRVLGSQNWMSYCRFSLTSTNQRKRTVLLSPFAPDVAKKVFSCVWSERTALTSLLSKRELSVFW